MANNNVKATHSQTGAHDPDPRDDDDDVAEDDHQETVHTGTPSHDNEQGITIAFGEADKHEERAQRPNRAVTCHQNV